MSQSYAAQILLQIASEMKRPPSAVEAFITILEENWYDTEEALKSVTDEQLEKMKIPLRIIALIREKITNGVQQKPVQVQVQQPPQQQVQQQPTQVSNVQVPKSKEQDEDHLKQQFNYQIQIIRSNIQDDQAFQKCLSTISKILTNVVSNPLNPQFYSIKISSKTLQTQVFCYPAAIEFMKKLGWNVEGENFALSQGKFEFPDLKLAIEALDVKIAQLLNVEDTNAFNPYKAYFSSTKDQTNSEIAQKNSYNVYSFTDQLERLHEKRKQIMSTPVTDRQVKVIFPQPQQMQEENFQQAQYEENDLIEPSQDPVLRDFLKQIASALEEQKFASKRKKEFDDLFKKPVYSETLIRVKFPEGLSLEARFNPLENLANLKQVIRENLKNPALDFYIYTTPPVRKYPTKDNFLTFEELDCVPSGLFYLGIENLPDDRLSERVLADVHYK